MQFDVIVIGGGGSGLAAAVSAAEHGLGVVVLEKLSVCGGTTGMAVGSLTACNTSLQRAAGISDSVADHAVDVTKFAAVEVEARNNAPLRQMFLSESAATLEWLRGMGIVFQGPNPEPPNRVARMHNVVPGAQAYIATLQARLLRLGGTILCDCEVSGLEREAAGVVEQATVEQVTVGQVTARIAGEPIVLTARYGVVLAAGDYASSAQLIAQYKGPRFANIEGINPNSTGDGHRLAQSLGARLLNMDITYGPEIRFVAPAKVNPLRMLPTHGRLARMVGLCLPWVPKFVIQRVIKRLLVTWQHPENALFEHGAVLLNRHGERFCDETLWPDREIAIAQQPDKICYLLLDGQLVKQYSRWPHFISTAPRIAYAYVADYEKLRPDVTVRRATLEQIAAARGMDAQRLEAALAKYHPSGRRRLEHGPWVLLGPAKAYFTTTEGGVAIDEQLRVLDEQGQVIAGLYAVGQNGLGGQILWGHGLHIGWAITSGRLVGQSLARRKALARLAR
jgi:succinate dehydrogenase/fumarate reductase flavoprotein subunit